METKFFRFYRKSRHSSKMKSTIKPLATRHSLLAIVEQSSTGQTASRGQTVVEALLMIVIFLSAVTFAMIQVGLITINSLIMNEAAFSTARVAIIAERDKDAEDITKLAAFFLTAPHLSPSNLILLGTSTSGKNPLDEAPEDYEKSDKQIRTYKTSIKYTAKLMFSGIIQPLFGDFDPFVVSGGRIGSFFSPSVSYMYPVTACARMVKSPDRSYYHRAYPDAKEW